VLVIATSDKGGTGRSVTSSNIVYRRSLQGHDVCYIDFDFGSPTAGAIFGVERAERGTKVGGMHSYLQGKIAEPEPIDVWRDSDREGMRSGGAPGVGRLVLFPGDRGGGEFPPTRDIVQRCSKLLVRLQAEFDLCLIDLSAGRSHAAEMILRATALPELRSIETRWLVFHRWTRQHVIAAHGLVYDDGLIQVGVEHGHDKDELTDSIRFVRTAVVDPESAELAGLKPTQVAWLHTCNSDLQELARGKGLGRTSVLASVPLDPLLQMREQLISDQDVWAKQIANAETIEAFDLIAQKLMDPKAWERL
jgi:hypothetical protein